jgi:hypothetical protein
MAAFGDIVNFPNVSITIAIALFITSFIMFGTQVGNQQNWAELRASITAIATINIIAVIFMTIALFFYMTRFATMTHILNLIMASVAVFASMTALSISLISKTQA